MSTQDRNILERWGISTSELSKLVDDNPSLRGIMLGYVAELKLMQALASNPHITSSVKDDDHDRSRKGDRRVTFRGREFVIEAKSLQTNRVKQLGNDRWRGVAQVDGSDRRTIQFDDGTKLETTLLLPGQFDVLAVNCFAFGGKWRWAFCRNSDLPRSNYRKYTPAQRASLIASLVNVEWPPSPPFYVSIFDVMDIMIKAGR